MRHRLRAAGLCLVLGVALNMAVAWICALSVYSNTASTFKRGFVYTSTDLWDI